MKNSRHKNRFVSINLNIRGINLSPTLAVNEKCRELHAKGKTIYNLGLGQSPFPVPLIVVEALKTHAHEKDYLPVKGLQTLREAVAKFHLQNDNVDIHPDNVLVGPGSKELMFLLQLVYYGDIILPAPCWVSYVPQAHIIGRNVKIIQTEQKSRWRITASALEAFLSEEKDQYKPRILVINYPSNPVGGTFSQSELKKIASVARKYNMIVLSDEIYGLLHHKGKHISIARFYPEGTIISSGLSKWCGAGGWRLGTFSFPPNFEWLLNAMAGVASETYTSVSAPIQYAAVNAFSGGIEIDRYLWHVRRILSFIAGKLVAIFRGSKINVHYPDGGFYLFPDFSAHSGKLAKRGITSSRILCQRLLEETGVAILPGESFQRPKDELTARIAYVNFDGSKAISYSETIPISEPLPHDFADTCCPALIKGVMEIARWVNLK